MKYLFILGRNITLSIAEVKSYLYRKNINLKGENLVKNGYFLELDKKLPENTINSLGGCISIGEFMSLVEEKEIDKIEIYMGENNNINYTLWDYSKNMERVKGYLKQRLKKEKVKAVFKNMNQNLDIQEGENLKIPSSKRLDEEYFVFNNFFGKIIQKSDYKEIERRDMGKPVRRSSLAISPRLAKIMINLSEVKENQKLVDPFCGVGIILQEALLQNILILGVDIDKHAISGARENLEWFNFDKGKYSLINESSTNVRISNSNVIVTEPDLGKILKKEISMSQTKKMLENFEDLMIKVLNNLKPKILGRKVFTSPLIKIGKKRFGCNIERIIENTHLRLIDSFEDYRENQIVGRKIFVLE